MNNIFQLREELLTDIYKHSPYYAFKISDPKPRDIHKATVPDRLLHHAVYRILYPFFDRTWIADSYSCRNGKGTHRALKQFTKFAGKVSKNNTKTCWVLKCDIRKFFASYADDFVILSTNKKSLEQLIPLIAQFLSSKLSLSLHPNKVSIATLASGIDFLGWVNFPNHKVLRTSTKNRMLRNLTEERNESRLQLYRGLLSHGNAKKLSTWYLV